MSDTTKDNLLRKRYEGPIMKWLGKDVETRVVVITCLTVRGTGATGDPASRVQEIWTIDGEKIGEFDPRLDVQGEQP